MIPAGAKTIDAYSSEGFTISGDMVRADILIMRDHIVSLNQDAAQSDEEMLTRAAALQPPPKLLVFGTGKTHRFIPPSLRQICKAHGIGLETMDTASAVRTYNILLAEAREVAGLFLRP